MSIRVCCLLYLDGTLLLYRLTDVTVPPTLASTRPPCRFIRRNEDDTFLFVNPSPRKSWGDITPYQRIIFHRTAPRMLHEREKDTIEVVCAIKRWRPPTLSCFQTASQGACIRPPGAAFGISAASPPGLNSILQTITSYLTLCPCSVGFCLRYDGYVRMATPKAIERTGLSRSNFEY